jgi:hypothetical protein
MSAPVPRPFSRWELARLWLSYERYAFCLLACAAAPIIGIAVVAPAVWWLWLLALVPVLKLLEFAREVHHRLPRKLRATIAAQRRIERGRFSPELVEGWCADPCFRVVAREVLARAGIPRAERRRLIKELAERARSRSDVVVFVDRERGVQVRVSGSEIERVVNEPV